MYDRRENNVLRINILFLPSTNFTLYPSTDQATYWSLKSLYLPLHKKLLVLHQLHGFLVQVDTRNRGSKFIDIFHAHTLKFIVVLKQEPELPLRNRYWSTPVWQCTPVGMYAMESLEPPINPRHSVPRVGKTSHCIERTGDSNR